MAATLSTTGDPIRPDPVRRRGLAIFFAVTGLIYLWICTDRTGNLFGQQVFGDVYDHLALSMVAGRLDLPPAVIGGEAFIVDGRYYGYWAPFPALLRVPLALTGTRLWVGHTSRLSCWLAAMLSVFAAWRVLVALVAVLGWKPPGPGLFFGYLAAIAWGTPLPYLLAGTSIYHEAVLWGSAAGMVAAGLGVEFLRRGNLAWLLGAVLAGGASALTRATTGFGALIGATGLLALYFWKHRGTAPDGGRPGATWRVAGLAVLTVVMFALPFFYNYVRFGSFVRLPYDKHPNVAAWRIAITRHGNFQPVNLLPNAATYFDPGQLDVRPGFPYFHLSAYRPRPGASIEHAEAYAGIPAFMTGLCLLALLGLASLGRDWRVVLLWAGGCATLVALLSFTAVAHRYEHDLFPLLVLMSAGGVLWLAQRRGRPATAARVLLVVLLAFGIWQSLSFAYFELEWARTWVSPVSSFQGGRTAAIGLAPT